MALTVKERAVRSLRVDKLKEERQPYLDAIGSGHKFSPFYATKVSLINEKIAAILA